MTRQRRRDDASVAAFWLKPNLDEVVKVITGKREKYIRTYLAVFLGYIFVL